MKYFRIAVLLLFGSQLSFAQDIDECRKVVDITIESINSGSSDSLITHLSDEFTIAGQSGELAKLVLSQLLSQLGEEVKSHQESRQGKVDKGLELVYTIDYMKLGLKEATFIFDESNSLLELSLLEMDVKTLDSDTKVEKSGADIIEVPFTMAGKLIAVEVLLNGKPRSFILDSGAPKVILNSKYLSAQDGTRRLISESKGVSGNISGMDIENVGHLDFYGLQLINQDVITMDLAHLEESQDAEIYGLIGYDLFKDYDLLFDYKKRKLTFINPSVYERYRNENLTKYSLQSVPFELEAHIPVVKVEVGTESYSYGIDCGAEINVISDALFLLLAEHTKHLKTNELIGADNRPKRVLKGLVKKTVIGNKKFKNLRTVFSDISHLNEGYQLSLDGLLGYEVLSKQKTMISFDRKEMIFIE